MIDYGSRTIALSPFHVLEKMDTQNDFVFRCDEQKPVNASQINSLYINQNTT